MGVNNPKALISISPEKFEKMTLEAIKETLKVLQEKAFKYFDNKCHLDDVTNYYMNVLTNVFLHIHLITYQGKIEKGDLSKILELFCNHTMKAFIMKKECGEDYGQND